jgi:hypothetical protein
MAKMDSTDSPVGTPNVKVISKNQWFKLLN